MLISHALSGDKLLLLSLLRFVDARSEGVDATYFFFLFLFNADQDSSVSLVSDSLLTVC